jgi:hypothetical protein
MSDETLRAFTRGRLTRGELTSEDCTKVFGGPSSGEICDACGEAIPKNQLVMECTGDHYPRSLQFHVRCFYIWDSERRELGGEPTCPSAPSEN